MVFEIALFAFLLAGDLLSKQLVAAFLATQPGERYVVLKDVFTFIYTENEGASFGVFSGQMTFLIVLTALVCVALTAFWLLKPNLSKNMRLSLVFIVSGAMGNLVDRIAFGYVRDFIDYTFLNSWFGINFAIGNIADIYVCIGALALVFYVLFEFKEEHFKGLRKFKFSDKKNG